MSSGVALAVALVVFAAVLSCATVAAWDDTELLGVVWHQATSSSPWGARRRVRTVVKGDKMYMAYGEPAQGAPNENFNVPNDVWSSEDCGFTWNLVTQHTTLPFRGLISMVHHESKVFVMGGFNGGTSLNDVWASEDLINYSIVTELAPWARRSKAEAISHEGYIYFQGGDGLPSDLWRSPNGLAWELVTPKYNALHPANVPGGAIRFAQFFVAGASKAMYVCTSEYGGFCVSSPNPPWTTGWWASHSVSPQGGREWMCVPPYPLASSPSTETVNLVPGSLIGERQTVTDGD